MGLDFYERLCYDDGNIGPERYLWNRESNFTEIWES